MPITSNPDAFYLSEGEFFARFGFAKPRPRPRAVVVGNGGEGKGEGEGEGGQGGQGKGGSTTGSRFSRTESPFSGKAKENEARSGLNGEDGEGVVDGADGGSGGEGAGYGEGGGEREEEGEGKGVEEVIFYCKAGVRSRAAARMAREWVGIKAGDMQGGWVEWESKGGEVER